LEVYRQKTEKEIRKLKEKQIEEYIVKHTKNMIPIKAWAFRDKYLKELGQKKTKKHSA
jgi:hypothetical protein